jgi:hypothetical protein
MRNGLSPCGTIKSSQPQENQQAKDARLFIDKIIRTRHVWQKFDVAIIFFRRKLSQNSDKVPSRGSGKVQYG